MENLIVVCLGLSRNPNVTSITMTLVPTIDYVIRQCHNWLHKPTTPKRGGYTIRLPIPSTPAVLLCNEGLKLKKKK